MCKINDQKMLIAAREKKLHYVKRTKIERQKTFCWKWSKSENRAKYSKH